MLRGLLVTGICALLVLTLFGANIAFAVERGPLNADHVTDSAEEAGLYTEIREEILTSVAEEELELPYPGVAERSDVILESVITEEWIQDEVSRNIHNFYDHLHHGERLNLYIDLEDREEYAADALRDEFTLADLEIEELDRLMANEESYAEERQKLRDRLLAEVGIDPDDGFGVELLQDMLASPESYDETRAEVREDIVEEVMDEAEADQGFGNERLHSMYADPTTFAAEQEAFQEEQKQRIQNETDAELSDEELEDIYEDERDDIIESSADEVIDRIEFEEGPDSIDDRVEDLATLKAEALATDMGHDEFTDSYDEIVADIEGDIVSDIEENPEEYADEIDEEVRAELDETDVPDELDDQIGAVVDVTVTAIVTDMTYEEFVDEYDKAVAEVKAAGAEYAWENRDEYADEFQDAEFDLNQLENVPDSIESETDSLIDLIAEAVLTDVEYSEFMDRIDEHEDSLADALAQTLFEEDILPRQIEFTDEIEESAADELDMLRTIVGMVLPIALGLTAVAFALTGGVYLVLRDVATTGIVTGIAAILTGIPSYALGALVPGILRDELMDEELPSGVFETILDTIELVVFAPLMGQALFLIGVGIVLVGGGLAVRLGLVDQIRDKLDND